MAITPGIIIPAVQPDYEKQVVALVNNERVKNGLRPLTINPRLNNIARIKSEDMQNNKYFSHDSPTFGSTLDLLEKAGIRYARAAENIAKGQTSPQTVVNSWVSSAPHRENLLGAEYTETGVGLAYNMGAPIWTQLFI